MNISGLMRSFIGETKVAEPKALELKVGEVVKGTVLQSFSDQDALMSIGGVQVRAKLETPLKPGDVTMLQVQPESETGQVVLKPMQSSNVPIAEVSLGEVLKTVGLPDSPANRQLVQALHQAGISLTKENVQAFADLQTRMPTQQTQEQWLPSAVIAFQKGLPLTPETVLSVRQAVQGEPFHATLTQLEALVQQELGGEGEASLSPQTRELLQSARQLVQQVRDAAGQLIASAGDDAAAADDAATTVGGAVEAQPRGSQGGAVAGQQASATGAAAMTIGSQGVAEEASRAVVGNSQQSQQQVSKDGATAAGGQRAFVGDDVVDGASEGVHGVAQRAASGSDVAAAEPQQKVPAAVEGAPRGAADGAGVNRAAGAQLQAGDVDSQQKAAAPAGEPGAEAADGDSAEPLPQRAAAPGQQQPEAQPRRSAEQAPAGAADTPQRIGDGRAQGSPAAAEARTGASGAQTPPGEAGASPGGASAASAGAAPAAPAAPAAAPAPSSDGHVLGRLMKALGVEHEHDAMKLLESRTADPASSAASPADAKAADTLKSVLLQLSQADDISSSLKDSAQQAVQQITGQQLMLSQDRTAMFSHVTLFVPLMNANGEQTAAIHIQSRKGKNGSLDESNCRLVFDLQMKAMGDTMVDVQVVNRIVSLNIHNNLPFTQQLLEASKEEIAQGLASVGYQFISMKCSPYPEKVAADTSGTSTESRETKPATPITSVYTQKPYKGMDIRV
ncbi:hypothetical protein [Paenibacillus cremeus]|uniref:Flagellar hook-length control protein FliK n=1 Tax=Paenibacillus cremeus TaxID=2163881 RepID=A0A559K9K0_9BACL|nr:hypothetical protein [Paenibacillus cremeus]TVY08798.1 hypothetical protein FPZ49_17255 [Paenibacillus cremeus]